MWGTRLRTVALPRAGVAISTKDIEIASIKDRGIASRP